MGASILERPDWAGHQDGLLTGLADAAGCQLGTERGLLTKTPTESLSSQRGGFRMTRLLTGFLSSPITSAPQD